MDKLDCMILNVLAESKADSSIRSISRKQILEDVEVGAQNLFIRLQKLMKIEFVANGLKEGREHTYFITKKGVKKLEEVINDEE